MKSPKNTISLLEQTYGPLDEECGATDDTIPDVMELNTISNFYDQLVSKEISLEDVNDNEVFKHVKEGFDAKLLQLASYPTACFWVQYMDMIRIL